MSASHFATISFCSRFELLCHLTNRYLDLTAVQEEDDEDEIDVNLEIPAPDGEDEAEEDAVGDRSYQTMSGTTAHENDTQNTDGGYEIDAYDFLAYAPEAFRAATELLKRFDSHKPVLLQVLKGIDHPDSSNATGFQQDVEAFNEAVEQMGSVFRNSILAPESVMESLFKQSMPGMTSKCQRVVELQQLLNLAAIVREFVGLSEPAAETAGMLEMLDGQVPFPFLKDINMPEAAPMVGNTYQQDATFHAALSIRLYSAVLQIQENFGGEDFNASKIVGDMFFVPGSENTLRVWDVNAIGAGDLGLLPEFNTIMRLKIKRLLNAVEDDETEIGLGSEDGLKNVTANFPWIDFRVTVARWARLRMREIAESINGAGGIAKLIGEVKKALNKNADFDPMLIPVVGSAQKTGRHSSAR